MGRVITAPGVLKNVQGQIDHVLEIYDDVKDNNLKPLTITLDAVESANGAYSHTTEDDRITEDMKPVAIEVGTPESFYAPITVTTGDGTVTLQCADAHGNSTVKVTFVKTSPVEGGEDYPPAITSTEFDILADRIGSLETLETTDQSDLVSAINEVKEEIQTAVFASLTEFKNYVSSMLTNGHCSFLCTSAVSNYITGNSSVATGIMTKISSSIVDIIWTTNSTNNAGSTRYDIQNDTFAINDINSQLIPKAISTVALVGNAAAVAAAARSIAAYRVGKYVHVGGYFSQASEITDGTKIIAGLPTPIEASSRYVAKSSNGTTRALYWTGNGFSVTGGSITALEFAFDYITAS